MPRRRKTQSGAPAQKIGSVQGQRYGEGVAQEQMQAQMPAPDNRVMAARPSAPTPPAGGPPAPAQAPTPALSLQEILQRAQSAPSPGMGSLFAPSTRPDEPITAGLSTGPGPGPEALGPALSVSTQGKFLRELTERTGNPYFARLADRSGL